MDTGEVARFLCAFGFICCTVFFILSQIEYRRSHKRFEQRMKNLGFNADGSRQRDVSEILSTENQEVRSALIEKWDGKDLKKIDSDEKGDLFITLTPPIRKFIKVLNSTAESDGTFKTYWLRVPANIDTAKEAVAWTFGLDAIALAMWNENSRPGVAKNLKATALAPTTNG